MENTTKLYVITGSCSDAVVALCKYLDIEIDILEKSSSNESALYKINPRGAVPTLSGGGQVLTETSSILNYLGRMHSPTIVPETVKELSQLEEVMSFVATSVYSAFLLYFRPDMSSDDENTHDSIKAKSSLAINEVLDELQDRLGTGTYILGDSISTADFMVMAMLRWANAIDVELLVLRPLLETYFENLRSQKFYKDAFEASSS